MHLINAQDRVTIKTFKPTKRLKDMVDTGYRALFSTGRDMKVVPDDANNLLSFNKKFISPNAVSSQISQKVRVYDT